ncbi:alpha/beta-hydrolase [Trematosphaeria pertusa]|uniref:Carboxypeptidase n=1 Tax=Trematosphaeria pertusa TaxID=390896 RepID=A0A6A6IAU8_9PLEO|nr:alpha/beta-hydrolase [Trematosphaeria pertusa]KAF2247337.1 alpha/beta-hydrolase [Trematosphaeria pertusa]
MVVASWAIWPLSTLVFVASAGSFPPAPEGLSVIDSTKFPGVSISYKETKICETTDGVKSYSGYVHLPPNSDESRDYESHMYFWFFEARNDAENAPLSVWLQGGPGVPSVTAAIGENGPCIVLDDSRSTELNAWSWNDKVSMLYIDQPVQVGFSYDSLVNGTIDEVKTPFAYNPANFSQTGIPETNLTFLTGTFASRDLYNAPNTTIAAAPVMWHFMQAWMQGFPEYQSKSNSFSIWGESYAGHYAPVYAAYFEQQNDRIANGSITGSAIQLHLDTVGLVNACIDMDTQMPFYPEFAFNNTYGFRTINETQYESAIAATETCRNMTATCRTMADEQDPEGLGTNLGVNEACLSAFMYCFATMHDGYTKERNLFDIAAPLYPEAFPPKWGAGYLNDAEIQQALGVPLNWTGNSLVVANGFNLTGDFVRGNGLANLGTLLDKGVKVALVYGDRDYQCNWMGGEAISLAIDSQMSTAFENAGYADIETNASYVGGLVRQYGNLSFSRVYQAGHEVPYYQPETAYQIFNRVMFNTDVATGKLATSSCNGTYSSTGLASAWTASELHLDEEPAQCYLWDVLETCTLAQGQILMNGSAVVKDFILVGYKAENGSEIFFDGSDGQGAGVGERGNNETQTGAANGRMPSGSMGRLAISVVVLVGLQIVAF